MGPTGDRRTTTLALVGAGAMSLVSFLPSGSASASLALLALLLFGFGSGLVARRWIDPLAVGTGCAAGVLLAGVIQSRLPGGPSNASILSGALVVGAIAAVVGLATVAARRVRG
jgi:hypothetical protein